MISYFIQNRKGDTLSFSGLNPRRGPLEFKPEKQSYGKQNQFGVITRGSFKQGKKTISLRFDVVAESPDQYYFELNRIGAFLYNQYNAPFYLYSVERRVRAKVSIENLKENFKESLETKLGLDCVLDLTMEDALWETNSDVTEAKTLANGDFIDVVIGEDAVDCAPIFTLTNVDSADNTEFALSVLNDDFAANMLIAANTFKPSSIFEIDCANAKLTLDSVSMGPSLIAGNYFPLLPGTNRITYECKTNQPVLLKAAYRIRRLM